MLKRHGGRLSAVYRFRDLMLRRDGFTVMPPVLAETDRAFRLGRDGARAASARRVMRIVETERIVSAVPHWRDYLVREWPKAELPAAILHPRGDAEARQWRGWLRQGWSQGTALADDIFAADLERLNRTFTGLVLWHRASPGGNGLHPLRRDYAYGGERPRPSRPHRGDPRRPRPRRPLRAAPAAVEGRSPTPRLVEAPPSGGGLP